MINDVYILAARRSAIGTYLGVFKDTSPVNLGAAVVKDIVERTGVNPQDIDEVIVGNVLSAGQGQGIARQVALQGGLPESVSAYAVNMVCGSGLKTVMNGYQAIKAGEHSLILAGGTESMSQAPYLIPYTVRSGHKMGNITMIDHMVHDALTDAFEQIHMGVTAENIAQKYSISRESQDAFALESQRKAIHAIDAGYFNHEIVPIPVKKRKEVIMVDVDEYPNRTTDLKKMSQLRSVFLEGGSVTAGNASGLNDGASFVMLADASMIEKYGIKPLCRIVSVAQAGVDPAFMGLGPTPAIIKSLKRAGLTLNDIDCIELNEAFAAQSLGVIHELCTHFNLDEKQLSSKINVNGGAIALGHPVGASGNRILVSLIHELIRSKTRYGLASLCIGGGMGVAVIIERL